VLERLHVAGSLDDTDYRAMKDGYTLLRALDHHLRLIVGRSTRLPATDHPTIRDLARKLNYDSASELAASLATYMQNIRDAYDHITTKGRNPESRIQNPE
jgi:glutamine synthetase adenylyltransferase